MPWLKRFAVTSTPASRDDGRPMLRSERRLHPLSSLFAIQQSAKQFVVPAIFGVFAASRRDAWEVWAAVVIVPIALAALGRALTVRYRFDETEFVLRSGFFFKRVRHIPYDRIQNVDAVQNVLHRALGVLDVRIETGGGSEAEAVLRVVNHEALAEIRAHVFAHRAAPRPADASHPEVEAQPAAVLLALPAREVMLFGLIQGRGMIVVGALFGLLWETGLMDRVSALAFDEGRAGRGLVRQLLLAALGDDAWPVWPMARALIALTVVLSLFRIASALWTFVTYYGFTLTRSGDDLRCEYGLLTRVTSTIPLHRIQQVSVRDGPWHRIGARVSIAAQTAGGTAAEELASTRAWLAPLLHRRDLARLLNTLIVDAPAEAAWQQVQPRGARREFVALSLSVVTPVSAVAAYLFGWRAVPVAALLLVWAIATARRTVSAMSWSTSGKAIQFRRGWIWRTHLMTPVGKVQAVSRRESPFDRRHRMASVLVDTAGRTQVDASLHIPYLLRADADALSGYLAASAARTEFRW